MAAAEETRVKIALDSGRKATGREEEEDVITDILTIMLIEGSNWTKLNSLRT